MKRNRKQFIVTELKGRCQQYAVPNSNLQSLCHCLGHVHKKDLSRYVWQKQNPSRKLQYNWFASTTICSIKEVFESLECVNKPKTPTSVVQFTETIFLLGDLLNTF